MKNKSKIKTIIISLALFFAFLSNNNYNIFNDQGENDGTIEIRGSYIESFIHIDGNWSETASTYAWCSGDGSWGNPYVIENVIINASGSPTGCGIFINNSKNDYFIIRYCTVYDAERILWYGAGIKLENSNNGTLINNDCSNNGWSGILLINNCYNNTILANIANYNGEFGIGLTYNSDDNIIIGNTANNNGQRGIWVERGSENNIISGNTLNKNAFGIYLWVSCDNNIISGNTINYNFRGVFFQQNCDNNIISNNIVNENTYTGIYLYLYSINNIINGNVIYHNDEGISLETDCDSNIIIANLIKDNQNYGINIRTSNCENNLIYQNSLMGTSGWHGRDNGANNRWDNSLIGNYWDNHTSPDSDNDGIVDIPYTWIMGNAGSQDDFPLRFSPLFFANEIHIDADGINAPTWSRTVELNLWCTGFGTYSDPYIINGVEIDAGGIGSGIYIQNSENQYFIISNCIVYNGQYGIRLNNTSNGTLINNDCSYNSYAGIFLFDNCHNNTLLENNASDNYYGVQLRSNCDYNKIINGSINNNQLGINLEDYSDNNIIIGSNLSENIQRGVAIEDWSSNNTITGNIMNSHLWDGIILYRYCDYNIITHNIINENGWSGIWLTVYCDNNTISENTANQNADHGIYIDRYCYDNIISRNTVSENDNSGIYLSEDCDNNIINANFIKDNQNYGINIINTNCENNLIYHNSLIRTTGFHARDSGTNNHWDNSVIGNYWDNHTTPDADNNGIVDIPYTWITGSANSVDHFPLTEIPIHLGEIIHIDDSGVNALDWSATAKVKLWCTGSGTVSDPYLIDGLQIDAGGSGSGILIENSMVNFIICNCEISNSLYGASFPNNDAGIKLINVNNGVIVNNSLLYNDYGICIEGSYNEVVGNNLIGTDWGTGILVVGNNNIFQWNIVEHHWQGILFYGYYGDCDNNDVSRNTFNTNVNYGIILYYFCDNNTITENTANNNGASGIYIYYYCDNNTITENTANNNSYYGIYVYYSNINTISGNNANNNSYYGIYVYYSNINTISGNNANNNSYYGISVYYSNNNIISGNTANSNSYHGIYVYYYSNNNSILGNTANDNEQYGILLHRNCDNTSILGNNLNNNMYGIYLINSYRAELSGNNLKECGVMVEGSLTQLSSHMIYPNNLVNGRSLYYYVNKSGLGAANFTGGGQALLFYCNNSVISNLNASHTSTGIYLSHCNNNTIIGNILNNNSQYGIYLNEDCDHNTISQNYMYFNTHGAINISSASCDDNIIERNVLVSTDWKFIKDGGTNTTVKFNYFSDILPSFGVELIAQSFSTNEFVVTLKILCEVAGFGVPDSSIQMWWDGTIVSSNKITNLGDGLYNISLTPIFVAPDEDPIILNMTISSDLHRDKYFETYISVVPPEIVKYLQVEITDHSYSTEHFDLTFFVFDETGQGIDLSSFQVWWNGVDVSIDVQNLGNGYYFISLDPITVLPGEDPILLNMTISAIGYEDKYFETYIAVDPDSLLKDRGEPMEEFPLTLIIVLSAIIGGTIIGVVSLYWFRRRKIEPQF